MPSPFMVMATQNPIEYEGTFPLPEAQLDRFLIRVNLGYPSARDEVTVLDEQQDGPPHRPAGGGDRRGRDPPAAARRARDLHRPAHQAVHRGLAGATRQHEDVYLGASPRGSIALFRTAQARALLEGRDYVVPDDVKELAFVTLGHRVIVNPGGAREGRHGGGRGGRLPGARARARARARV